MNKYYYIPPTENGAVSNRLLSGVARLFTRTMRGAAIRLDTAYLLTLKIYLFLTLYHNVEMHLNGQSHFCKENSEWIFCDNFFFEKLHSLIIRIFCIGSKKIAIYYVF